MESSNILLDTDQKNFFLDFLFVCLGLRQYS